GFKSHACFSAGAEVVTPANWPLEVANVLLMAERRKRISVAQVTALLRRIRELPISVETVDPDRAFDQVLAVARQQQLTEYDAAYVELAFAEALPRVPPVAKFRKEAGFAGFRWFSFYLPAVGLNPN